MSNPPPLDYGRPFAARRLGNPLLLAAIMIVTFVVLFTFMDTDRMPARAKANQIKCAYNLRRIAQYTLQYSQANGGSYAPDLPTLFTSQRMPVTLLGCPGTNDDPHGKTPTTIGQCSYIYTGAGLTTRSRPDCILLVEDPANHKLEGSNVLFADGHVEFVDLPTIQLFLNTLNVGRNPPITSKHALTMAAAEQDYQKNWKPRMPQLKTGVWRIPTTRPAISPE